MSWGSPVSAILNHNAYKWSLSRLRGIARELKGLGAAIHWGAEYDSGGVAALQVGGRYIICKPAILFCTNQPC